MSWVRVMVSVFEWVLLAGWSVGVGVQLLKLGSGGKFSSSDLTTSWVVDDTITGRIVADSTIF